MTGLKRLLSLACSILLAITCVTGAFTVSGYSLAGAVSNAASFSINQKNATVKNAQQKITGRLKIKNEKTKVTYKVYSEIDKGSLSFEGEADMSNGAFNIDDIKLKPHTNKIVITAEAPDGKTEVKTLYVDYDSSFIKDSPADNITRVEDGSGLLYVNNNLLVYFEENISETKRQEIIDTIGGTCAGYVNGINMWQVEVAPAAYESLQKTAEQLTALDEVFYAGCNMAQAAAPMVTAVTPSDPWGSASWDELNPQNANWSVEAIQAPSAWSYDWAFNHIDIGIVDAGVQSSHEDLAGKVFFPDAASEAENDETDSHGTHVAGIIGATPNNSKGVTGILWDTSMYCVDWDVSGSADANLFAGLTETVQAGAKVVNFSLGLAKDIAGYGPAETNQHVISYARQSEAVMTSLLNKGYDFIVCQSAGNGQNGNSQDAVFNGYFCSITDDNLTGTLEMNQKINDRIIIVGSAQRTGVLSFMQAATSNAGSQVDVCAPGVSVYSCLAGNTYGNLSGTSMSSPEAAGVAALTWSVNPALTGAQVRSIVVDPSNTPYTVADNTSSHHPLVNTYGMVNAKKCVEAAIATKPANSAPILHADPNTATEGNVTVAIKYPPDALFKEYQIGDGEWIEYTVPVVLTSNSTVKARYAYTAGNFSDIGTVIVNNIIPPKIIKITFNGSKADNPLKFKVLWYKYYRNENTQLRYETIQSGNVRVVWSSDNTSKVMVDQDGKITNAKMWARSANITATLINSSNNSVIATDTVKVIFYKFDWQLDNLR